MAFWDKIKNRWVMEFRNKFLGFTLTEMLVVLIIVGILIAIALPQFGKAKEDSYDREAKINLKLIQAAEKIYHVEYSPAYYPSTSTEVTTVSDINNYLRLAIPTTGSWNYHVKTAGSVNSYCADRTASGSTRRWNMTVGQTEPGNYTGACTNSNY